MGDCSQFPVSNANCQNIQLIEPDFTLPVVVIPPPGNDPGLTERGEVPLDASSGVVSVTFLAPKLGDYRFEYLYVDSLGVSSPGAINVVPVSQTPYGFTVDLSGIPLVAGTSVLRWHVVVISVSATPPAVDAPESFRVQMPHATSLPAPPLPDASISMLVVFTNARSTTDYGFSELRVANLVHVPSQQSIIGIQVYAKMTTGFRLLFRPVPPNANYYLVGRTP